MKVEGVPETVSRAALLRFMEDAGFDIKTVTTVQWQPNYVVAAVKVQRDGRDVLDCDRLGVLTNVVHIPFAEDEAVLNEQPGTATHTPGG